MNEPISRVAEVETRLCPGVKWGGGGWMVGLQVQSLAHGGGVEG